ncbi:MAG: hypothetical protein HRU20_06595, partial [Pseudomonadales bacterium]|nr:hypothetical protein [Pseudomonadales bacterium]
EALQSEGIELTHVESQFFSSKQAQANKYRFDFEGVRGSLLIVNSHYWRAQHEPHNCYIGQGYKLGFEGTWLLGGGKTVRFLQVGTPEQTAIYWFQAGDTITAEYSARVLDAVLAPEKNWLMVSLLLDENHRQDEVDKLLGLLQRSLGLQISEG